MKIRLLALFLLLFLFAKYQVFAQKTILTKLKADYSKSQSDTNKVRLLISIAQEYHKSNLDSAVFFAQTAYQIALKSQNIRKQTQALSALGTSYRFKNNFDKSVEAFNQALILAEKYNYPKDLCDIYNGLGIAHENHSKYPQALEYYFKVVKIAEQSNQLDMLGISYTNIGIVYRVQKEYEKAIEYYQKSSLIYEKVGDKRGVGIALNNIGNIYYFQKNPDKALDYYERNKKIREELKDKRGLAIALNNIATIKAEKDKIDEALELYKESLKLRVEVGDKRGQGSTLNHIATTYKRKKDYEKSIENALKSLSMAQELKIPYDIKENYQLLYDVYKEIKNYEKSLEYFEKHKNLNDSLFSLEKSKALANLTSTMELERKQKELVLLAKDNELTKISAEKQQRELEITKKQAEADQLLALAKQEKDKRKADSLFNLSQKAQLQADKLKAENQTKNLEIQKQKEEKEFQQIITYLVLAGFVSILIFSIFVVRSRQIQKKLNKALSQKTNELNEKNDELLVANQELHQQQEEIITQRDFIESQNQELGVQNKKMNDSVRAALTIQKALLPFETRINKFLKEYFVLFLPKDVVSGDFYWIEEKDGKKIIIAADCTGHGVPGAFMSLIGMSLLDKIVMQQGITNPAEILTNLHELVRYALKQEESDNQNGMDIAVVCLDGNKIIFSGAKRPFYYIDIENKSKVLSLEETRKSIGGTQNENKYFINEEVILSTGSMFFIGSDGLLDQNNETRSKLKKADLFEILLNNFDKDMETQKNMVYNLLKNHMGKAEQRDDILWIGVKL